MVTIVNSRLARYDLQISAQGKETQGAVGMIVVQMLQGCQVLLIYAQRQKAVAFGRRLITDASIQ